MTEDRIKVVQNPVVKKLLGLMAEKQSNLALSLDVSSQDQFFNILERTAEHIVILKTHVDIIDGFDDKFIDRLLNLKDQYKFLIFEDRKFADIGNTVKSQYTAGIFRINDWADMVNAHVFPGPGIIEGLREAWSESKYPERGLILLPQMTSQGNLFNELTMSHAIQWAREYSDFVIGFIGAPTSPSKMRGEQQTQIAELTGLLKERLQRFLELLKSKKGDTEADLRKEFQELIRDKEVSQIKDKNQPSILSKKIKEANLLELREQTWPEFLIFTPGVKLGDKSDSLGQTYVTPEMAVEQGSDIIIVGRGIYEAREPGKAAAEYREAGWQALVERDAE